MFTGAKTYPQAKKSYLTSGFSSPQIIFGRVWRRADGELMVKTLYANLIVRNAERDGIAIAQFRFKFHWLGKWQKFRCTCEGHTCVKIPLFGHVMLSSRWEKDHIA